MAIRYRFFNRLDSNRNYLIMPAHVISNELYSILPFDDFKNDEGKQSSIITIFSIWNTMMGTSLLVMPWALQQAGFALGIFLILGVAFLAFYTAYRIVESKNGLILNVDSENANFSDVCRYFYGKTGEFIAIFFSIIVLIGGIIIYFIFMSNFLYYSGNIVYESLQPNSTLIPIMKNKTFTCDIYCISEKPVIYHDLLEIMQIYNISIKLPQFTTFWKKQGSVPIILAIITFPLLNFKSPTFFTKFNVLGTLSVIYLFLFTSSKVIECGIHMDFTNFNSTHFVKLYNGKFPALTGTLALSYFIHNAILTILKNQKNPKNNVRDLSIGYFLSAICYLFIGVMFFIAFPVKKSCISDNFLNNFGTEDVMSAIARVFLLFQMLTVLPLLFYLIRSQLSFIIKNTNYPGLSYVCLINLSILTIAIFFAIFYPYVGSILRLLGSISGLIYIFTLPTCVHMSRLKIQGKLTKLQICLHLFIIFLGILNLILQFLIKI